MKLLTRGAGTAAAAAVVLMAVGNVAEARGLKNDPSMPLMPEPTALGTTTKADEAPPTSETDRGNGYASLIESHARANGVPVALAHAIVRIESNYNPRARGRGGEVGLMQIKPQTARGAGYSGSASGLYDPDTNLRWGMKYLAGAYKLAGGEVCGTVMRYQGGHYARRMTKANSVYCSRARKIMAQGGFQTAGL